MLPWRLPLASGSVADSSDARHTFTLRRPYVTFQPRQQKPYWFVRAAIIGIVGAPTDSDGLRELTN